MPDDRSLTTRCTNEILDKVHEVSGRPVLVQQTAELRTLATVNTARGPAPAHVVLYHPSAASFADYLIAYQCGFLIRIFSTPQQDRFDLAPSYRGKKDVDRLVTERLRGKRQPLPKAAREQVRDQMLNGLGVQLRSAPVGLRVDAWIIEDYPELKEQQRTSVERQLQDNLGSLRPEIRQIAPEAVYAANLAMNAAYAIFWARALDQPHLATPFKASGHLSLGEQLLDILARVPTEPAKDRLLIEEWGKCLDIANWFEFAPGPSF